MPDGTCTPFSDDHRDHFLYASVACVLSKQPAARFSYCFKHDHIGRVVIFAAPLLQPGASLSTFRCNPDYHDSAATFYQVVCKRMSPVLQLYQRNAFSTSVTTRQTAWALALFCVSMLILWMSAKDSLGRPRPEYNLHTPTELSTFSFFVEFDEPVAMRIVDSAYYDIDTEQGAQEWAQLLPANGHTVHIADEDGVPHVHTVSLFHSLKCLDIVRRQFITTPVQTPPPILIRHCLQYLRLTFLCQPSLWLEPAHDLEGHVVRDYDAVCRDWTLIYSEAERNQRSYNYWAKMNTNSTST